MILDTNVISEFARPQPDKAVVEWFSSLPEDGLYIPALVKAEILLGIGRMPAGRRKMTLANFMTAFLEPYEQSRILPFENADAPCYARIVSTRESAGRPISLFDAQIAAIALRRDLPIATRNLRDFEECGVTLINPWDSPS